MEAVSPETITEVRSLREAIRESSDAEIVEFAFLELASPSIPEGIKNCVAQKADSIIVLLNFLNSGKHVNEDIPRIINEAKAQHPSVQIHISDPIGQHPSIPSLFLDMIKK